MNFILIIFIIFVILLIFFSMVKDSKIRKIQKMADTIYENVYKVKKPYSIYETSGYSKTINKRDIYLVVKNEHGVYFKDETILSVLLHEISHIECKNEPHTEESHSKKFYEIENKFIKEGKKLGYFSEDFEIDGSMFISENYPCKD